MMIAIMKSTDVVEKYLIDTLMGHGLQFLIRMGIWFIMFILKPVQILN